MKIGSVFKSLNFLLKLEFNSFAANKAFQSVFVIYHLIYNKADTLPKNLFSILFQKELSVKLKRQQVKNTYISLYNLIILTLMFG
jgi:hypothetical protein